MRLIEGCLEPRFVLVDPVTAPAATSQRAALPRYRSDRARSCAKGQCVVLRKATYDVLIRQGQSQPRRVARIAAWTRFLAPSCFNNSSM